MLQNPSPQTLIGGVGGPPPYAGWRPPGRSLILGETSTLRVPCSWGAVGGRWDSLRALEEPHVSAVISGNRDLGRMLQVIFVMIWVRGGLWLEDLAELKRLQLLVGLVSRSPLEAHSVPVGTTSAMPTGHDLGGRHRASFQGWGARRGPEAMKGGELTEML